MYKGNFSFSLGENNKETGVSKITKANHGTDKTYTLD